MKCETLQKKILLAQSGELAEQERTLLQAHIDECPDCRAYEADMSLLTASAKEHLPAGEPTREVLARIRETAEGGPQAVIFPRPVAQVLAYAAAIVLIVAGAYLVMGPGEPAGQAVESEMSDMHAILACLDDSSAQDAENEAENNPSGLSDMARWLLEVEGLAEEHHIDTGIFTGLEETLSTGLQSRSTREPTGKICV